MSIPKKVAIFFSWNYFIRLSVELLGKLKKNFFKLQEKLSDDSRFASYSHIKIPRAHSSQSTLKSGCSKVPLNHEKRKTKSLLIKRLNGKLFRNNNELSFTFEGKFSSRLWFMRDKLFLFNVFSCRWWTIKWVWASKIHSLNREREKKIDKRGTVTYRRGFFSGNFHDNTVEGGRAKTFEGEVKVSKHAPSVAFMNNSDTWRVRL